MNKEFIKKFIFDEEINPNKYLKVIYLNVLADFLMFLIPLCINKTLEKSRGN